MQGHHNKTIKIFYKLTCDALQFSCELQLKFK